MGKKTSDFTKVGISELAKDKPVVYKIIDKAGDNIYTGIAKRGRVEERLNEHLPKGKDPIPGGKKVKIIQQESIDKAEKAEQVIIQRSKPKYNKQSK